MKRPTHLRTKVFRTIEDISHREWHSVFPDVLESYHFFKSIEVSQFEKFSHYYILVYEQRKAVGAAACFMMEYPLETTIEGPLKTLVTRIRTIAPGFLSLRALICGSPMFEGRIGLGAKDGYPILRSIVARMERIARREKASLVAFKDFSAHHAHLLDHVRRHGFQKVMSYPSAYMDISFKTFDDYLKRLSRSTRKDLKRKFKRLDHLPAIEFKVATTAEGHLDDIYALYKQTYSRSGTQFEEAPKDFFKNISENMPHNTKYFLWKIDKKLVAFNLCLVSRDTLLDEYIGFDYSLAHDYHLYFVTFRDVLTWCVENHIKKYETGAMTYEPKRRLGCSFVPTFIYAKHMNRIINPLFKLLCIFLRPENFDEMLKDMKRRALL